MASATIDFEATTAPSAAQRPPSSLPDAAPTYLAARAGTKRQRESSLPLDPFHTSGDFSPSKSPVKAARIALAGANPGFQLTGAAALEDQRRRRFEEEQDYQAPAPIPENQSHKVLAALIAGGVEPMSRPEAPSQLAPTAEMEPAAKAASALAAVANSAARLEENTDANTEQVSHSAGPPMITSPSPMEVDDGKHLSPEHPDDHEDRHQPGSLSYPGSSFATAHLSDTARGMTYPISSPVQSSPTASGTKKHRCPYCSTEFTRHHNLKSHLLTHSQEKPYVCTECQMRFRRLHDLKRHGKLHTGEKPHICPKCDRKFARGDALARHTKGAGGCAGRRSSLNSFADGDELDGSIAEADESAMSGMTYEHADEDSRRQSLPGNGHPPEQYSAHSRTYPPSGSRPSAPGIYPPNNVQTQSSNSTVSSNQNSLGTSRTGNTSISSAMTGNGNAVLYSQNNMTESPKALSPALPLPETAGHGRPRSPQQNQQAQTGRRQSPSAGQRPKLPALSHSNFAASATTSGFSHARSPAETNMFAQSDPSVWAYIQSIEDKMKTLGEEMETLKKRVEALESGEAN